MKRARINYEGNFVENSAEFFEGNIVDVTDEQYGLLRSGKAQYFPGQGVVLKDREDVSLRHATARVMRRDYRHPSGTMVSDLRAALHDVDTDKPYQGVLGMAGTELLGRLMVEAGVFDGDEFEVCVTVTGRRPHGDRWFIKDGSQFRPETDEECLRRIESHGN